MTESVSESSATILSNSTVKKSMKILHVDDDPSFLKVTKQCLETQGEFEVDTASSVDEALEKLKKADYDIVVSDYQMPGKDGLEFLKELRDIGNTVPFIVFTGKGREEIAIKALNLGVDQYIDKHGDPETVYCELAHDIRATLRIKGAEDAKRRTEERYRILLESISDSVYVLDREWRHVTVNEAGASFTHIPVDKLLGNKLTDLFPGVEKTPFFAAFRRVMETRKPETVDSKYVFEDGREGWCEVDVYPVPEGILCISSDITERKQMEKQLKESEEKYRNLVENSQDAIAIVNFKGNVLFANRAAERLTGYTLKEGKGLNIRVVTPKRYWPKSVAMLLKARMGKPIPYFEYELRRKDGTIVPVETGGQAIFEDGKPVAIQIITREVTERMKTEEALRQSEEKHRDLFENAMDVILTLDLKGSITAVNNSVLRFGYKKEDLVGKNILDFVSKEYWPAVMRDFSKVARGEPAKNETELVVPAGKILVEYNAGAIVKENNVAGVQINIRDVTERKKAEEERRETMEKVQMMNEKLRVVGGLTRHDVNNKLAAVTGNVYLARKKLPMNSEVLDYLKQIEASVEQTVRIFDFAKAYEMLGVEELAYVDVEKTVDEAVSLFPSLKDVKVMNDCHGLTVLADSLLRQLFYNLIDNSLKHGEKPSRIRVFYEEKKDHLNVIYEDDGVGISQAAKPKLFDEGFTTGKGSGHGLYLVKKMMEVYGWTIQETGMPGKGAKFTIIIPRTNQNGKENYRLH